MKNLKLKFPTCSLCENWCPNREICTIKQIEVEGFETEYAPICIKEGNFVRSMNVIPEKSHYYADGEVPSGWKMDFSRLPKDANGVPLFVFTKRGCERAIPAVEGMELEGDEFFGVNLYSTFQGQRELIYDLGVEEAKKIMKSQNIPLYILPNEFVDYKEQEVEKKPPTRSMWISDVPIKEWNRP